MGNRIPRPPGKVILSDGSVQEFQQPLTVAELMLDHPQHLVAEFRSNNKPAPLPADETLNTNKVYVMIPLKHGKASAALSADEIQRILNKSRSLLRWSSLLPCSPKILPLLSCMCPTGVGVCTGKRGTEFVLDGAEDRRTDKAEKKRSESSLLLLEGFNERPEYLNRQISSKGWKPTLDTITESAVEKKVPHWLF